MVMLSTDAHPAWLVRVVLTLDLCDGTRAQLGLSAACWQGEMFTCIGQRTGAGSKSVWKMPDVVEIACFLT